MILTSELIEIFKKYRINPPSYLSPRDDYHRPVLVVGLKAALHSEITHVIVAIKGSPARGWWEFQPTRGGEVIYDGRLGQAIKEHWRSGDRNPRFGKLFHALIEVFELAVQRRCLEIAGGIDNTIPESRAAQPYGLLPGRTWVPLE